MGTIDLWIFPTSFRLRVEIAISIPHLAFFASVCASINCARLYFFFFFFFLFYVFPFFRFNFFLCQVFNPNDYISI